MKILHGDRSLIYRLVAAAFKSLNVIPTIAELGVLRGDNALILKQILEPKIMYLVDSWSPEAFQEYQQRNTDRGWVDDCSIFSGYYKGSVLEADTFDAIYHEVESKFRNDPNVRLIRSKTAEAFRYLKGESSDFSLNYIYVDANHEYEMVLDDLMLYSQFSDELSVIQLNDCCHSFAGVKQNLGVLEAVTKFCKLRSYTPVFLTNTDWSDVLLTPTKSRLVSVFDRLVDLNEISFIEVPPSLLGASRVRYGKRANLSFV